MCGTQERRLGARRDYGCDRAMAVVDERSYDTWQTLMVAVQPGPFAVQATRSITHRAALRHKHHAEEPQPECNKPCEDPPVRPPILCHGFMLHATCCCSAHLPHLCVLLLLLSPLAVAALLFLVFPRGCPCGITTCGCNERGRSRSSGSSAGSSASAGPSSTSSTSSTSSSSANTRLNLTHCGLGTIRASTIANPGRLLRRLYTTLKALLNGAIFLLLKRNHNRNRDTQRKLRQCGWEYVCSTSASTLTKHVQIHPKWQGLPCFRPQQGPTASACKTRRKTACQRPCSWMPHRPGCHWRHPTASLSCRWRQWP